MHKEIPRHVYDLRENRKEEGQKSRDGGYHLARIILVGLNFYCPGCLPISTPDINGTILINPNLTKLWGNTIKATNSSTLSP